MNIIVDYLKSTGGSSVKYGNCDICGKPATEVFDMSLSIRHSDHISHWKDIFGHKECLERKYRGSTGEGAMK